MLTHVHSDIMKIFHPENVMLVIHPAELVMPELDQLLENVPFVTTVTIVHTDNSVAHLWEDVSTLKPSVTEMMSTKPDTKTVTLVALHTS